MDIKTQALKKLRESTIRICELQDEHASLKAAEQELQVQCLELSQKLNEVCKRTARVYSTLNEVNNERARVQADLYAVWTDEARKK